MVRRLVARGAPIEVAIAADPRFDYGRAIPTWTCAPSLALAEGGESRMAFTSPWPWREEGPGVTAPAEWSTRARPIFAQVRWGEAPGPRADPAVAAVGDRRVLAGLGLAPGGSAAAGRGPLAPVGGTLGARAQAPRRTPIPGCSLPRRPPPFRSGPAVARNWDYRYVWIRDAAFTAQVLLLLGHVSEARAYVAWAFDRAAQLAEGEELRAMFTVDGRDPPSEASSATSRGTGAPGRSGSGTARPASANSTSTGRSSTPLTARAARPGVRAGPLATIERLAKRISKLWSLPDSGMWEIAPPPDHHVHSKLMCWVALDRALQLAQAFGEDRAGRSVDAGRRGDPGRDPLPRV